MLHRFRLAGALALLIGLTGCAEYGYTQRSSYPAPSRRAPTYDTGGYDRGPSRTADRRVEQDAADYAAFVNRNLHLSERQEYAIRDILEDRAYRALDRREAYPFPRRNGYARGFWRDADRRIERVLDRYQRDYYRHLTGRGERYYREVYYYDYSYVHYDRFPTRWRSRHDRTYYRSRSRSYRNDRGRYNNRNDRRNGRADRDGNRGRVEGRADHNRNRAVSDRPTRNNRNVNDRRDQRQRAERQRVERQQQARRAEQQRAERQRTERQQQAQRAERQRQEARTERQRTERQRTQRRAEQRSDRREQRTDRRTDRREQRTERPSRQRTERGSRSGNNGRSSRGRTSRGDG